MQQLMNKDYDNTLKFIDKCDDHIFKIKNWVLITVSAVIAFGITKDKEIVIIANLAIILAFLYLELFYKSLQDDAISHSSKLESRLEEFCKGNESDSIDGYSFGIGKVLTYPKLEKMWKTLSHPYRRHIVIFYSFLLEYSLGAFCIGKFL